MKKKLLTFTLILLLALLLTRLLQDFSRQLIVPLLFLAWVGRLLLESIPQAVIWGVFVAIVLLIAGRTLLRQRSDAQPYARPKPPPPGRLETWANLLRQADQETYYRWQLAQPLRELSLAILAYTERQPASEIKAGLTEPDLALPPPIQAYLQASMTSFSRLIAPRTLFRSAPPSSPLDLDPEQIIQFLEDQLDYRTD